MDGGLYTNPVLYQALRAEFNGVAATPSHSCSLREQETGKTLSSA
jgi:hypothetical protein